MTIQSPVAIVRLAAAVAMSRITVYSASPAAEAVATVGAVGVAAGVAGRDQGEVSS